MRLEPIAPEALTAEQKPLYLTPQVFATPVAITFWLGFLSGPQPDTRFVRMKSIRSSWAPWSTTFSAEVFLAVRRMRGIDI
jgi:hypothetical protein